MKRKCRLHPKRLIGTLHKIIREAKGNKVKNSYSLPAEKNTILTVIAIILSDKFRINEIARHLPVSVKKVKYKQTRLLRFLKRKYPKKAVMIQWAKFVLVKVYRNVKGKIVFLIDETDLLGPFKAIVVAIPFRKRAIPIYWKIYTNKQIQDMVYRSHNTLLWDFLDELKQVQQQALGEKRRFIWIFDRGFADVKLMKRLKKQGIHFIIRVRRNVGVEVEGFVGKLGNFSRRGYFPNVVYHKEERIRVNLYCAWDTSDDDDELMLLVSNEPSAMLFLYKQRMKIEEGFRDLKSLFGFRALVLKSLTQARMELLWLLNVMSMGLSFLLYEKSGYRWAKQFNDSRKQFSLIHVIKDKLQERWKSFRLNPYFSLPLLQADIVAL